MACLYLLQIEEDKRLIPWSLIHKETVMKSVKHCTSPKYGIDVYVVDKTMVKS